MEFFLRQLKYEVNEKFPTFLVKYHSHKILIILSIESLYV